MNTRRMKEVKQEKHLTNYQISKRSGIHPSVVANIINGKVDNPKVETVKKLADAMRISVSEII